MQISRDMPHLASQDRRGTYLSEKGIRRRYIAGKANEYCTNKTIQTKRMYIGQARRQDRSTEIDYLLYIYILFILFKVLNNTLIIQYRS